MTENPELVRSPTPPAMTNFGDVVTIKHVRKSRIQSKSYDRMLYDGNHEQETQ